MTKILFLTSTNGAGKGTFAKLLVQYYGATHYQARAFIREHIPEGIEITREVFRKTADKLRREHGEDFVIRSLYEKAIEEDHKLVVIESVRCPEEVDFIKSLKSEKTLLVAIDAEEHIRYQRITTRDTETDRVSLEEFRNQESLESAKNDDTAMDLHRCMNQADITIQNNSALEAHLLEEIRRRLNGFIAGK